jgi:hypothetical protein
MFKLIRKETGWKNFQLNSSGSGHGQGAFFKINNESSDTIKAGI